MSVKQFKSAQKYNLYQGNYVLIKKKKNRPTVGASFNSVRANQSRNLKGREHTNCMEKFWSRLWQVLPSTCKIFTISNKPKVITINLLYIYGAKNTTQTGYQENKMKAIKLFNLTSFACLIRVCYFSVYHD